MSFAKLLGRLGIDPPAGCEVSIWTVYDSPRDYPGKFVARRFCLTTPTDDLLVADTYAELRNCLTAFGLYRVDRNPADDPVIVEVWI